MEAPVLNQQLLPEVDCNGNSLGAELEVKKLQELVRRLERQNEQLRTRASGTRTTGSCCLPGPLHPSLACRSSLGSFCASDDVFEYFHPHTADEDEDGDEEEEDDEEDEEEEGEHSVLDELELLEPDTLLSPEESDETWLYVSSRGGVLAPLTPLQWCRQVLDGQRSELVEAARRALCHRLDQVSRWRHSFSSPPSPAPSLSRVSPMGASPSPCSTPQAYAKHALSLSSPLHLQQTLSPMSRDPSGLSERTPTFFPHAASRGRSVRSSLLSPQSSLDGELSASEDDDSIVMGYKLQDLTDVQVMARLQEDSLRQDYASSSPVLGRAKHRSSRNTGSGLATHRSSSTLLGLATHRSSSSTGLATHRTSSTTASGLATRRSHSFSFQLSQLSAAPGLEEDEEEEDDDEDYGLLPPPQARLTRLPHSHTFSSSRDWRRSTSSLCTPPSSPCAPCTPCTPPPYHSAGLSFQPHSPAGPYTPEQLHHGFRPGSDKLRRSMPNLVRAPSMPSVPIPANPSASPSSLRNSQSFDSSSGLMRLQSSIPSPGQLQTRVQSVGNFTSLSRQPLKATAYVSPTVKGAVAMPTTPASLPSPGGGGSGIPLPSKPPGGGGSTSPASTPTTPRSGLPRPASFMGGSAPRSKIGQPARSLLTPPRSLSTLSALHDGSWRDGCY